MKNKTLNLLLLIIMGVFASCSEGTDQVKQKFENKKGRFKIGFPAEPEMEHHVNHSQIGNIESYSFEVKDVENGGIKYQLHYLDYPAGYLDTITEAGTYNLLNSTQASTANSSKMQLMEMTNRKISGYWGREFKWMDNSKGVISKVLLYLVHNRLYAISLEYRKEDDFLKEIDAFLNSFELMDTKTNPNAKPEAKSEVTFEAIFPGPAEIRQQENFTEFGMAKVLIRGYQPSGEDENLTYVGMEIRYESVPLNDTLNLDQYYNHMIEASLASTQAKLISRKNIKLGKIEGVAFKAKMKGEIIMENRMFLAGNVSYCSQVATLAGKEGNISATRFFDSFRIKK